MDQQHTGHKAVTAQNEDNCYFHYRKWVLIFLKIKILLELSEVSSINKKNEAKFKAIW